MSQARRTWVRAAAVLVLWIFGAQVARAADRVPVAVLWMGEPSTLDEGRKIVAAVNESLAKTQGARSLDSADDRTVLVEGGPATAFEGFVSHAQLSFSKLKFADAAHAYEAAEKILLRDMPLSVTRAKWADVQRGLLASYDQLAMKAEAARAAEWVIYAAGTRDDITALLARHHVSRAWEPASPPVSVKTEPAGAMVSRNLQEVAPSPISVPGGDPALDFIDVELAGYRRAHVALPRSGEISVVLEKEDRLPMLVDDLRRAAPDAPPALVAQLGKRVGAKRVLVLAPDGKQVMARYLDVAAQKWAASSMRAEAGAHDAIALYASPDELKGQPAATTAKAPAKKSKLGAWGKWYTWVAAGAVVALVVGLLVAERVGDDKLTISATH